MRRPREGPDGLQFLRNLYAALFGLLAAIVWVLATKLSEANTPARPRTCWLFALFSLVLGLDRPEGVFLAGFALLAIMFARRCSGARDILVPFIAVFLRGYQDKHYTLATSEAGLLPFYSGWTALDTWGLNDAWIAHSGTVTVEYLDRFKPNVMMFNGRGLAFQKDSPDLDPWDSMVRILRQYSQDHHYRLAAVFGVNPYTAHYYYVRRDFADADAITMRLSSMTYRWRGSSIPAVNFLDYCSN